MVQRSVSLILLALLLASCAVTPPATRPPPHEPVNAETELSGSPALALLQRAEQAHAHNQMAAAGRYLERALGVAPDSSWLYQKLARLRLEQGDASAAEGLALHALQLAPDNERYQADLWQLVAVCRSRQGNQDGADRARKQASQLRETRT